MLQYLYEGLGYLEGSVLLGVILYVLYSVILVITKKRSLKAIRSMSKLKMGTEFLLIIYIYTILKVTGIVGRELSFDFSRQILSSISIIPFVGASIMMITLNIMLFVPYGFLVPLAFPECKFTYKNTFAIGFGSSLCIELFQLFSGRLFEIDDLIANTSGFLIGFLLLQAIQKIKSKGLRKKGIVQLICTIVMTAVALFLISFIANGDAIQRQEDDYYNGIGSPNYLEDEIASICEYYIYFNGEVMDVLKNPSADGEYWYSTMGDAIGNGAGVYEVQDNFSNMNDLLEQDTDKTYMEIIYDSPQLFRFYNNHDWVMEDVSHILYCVDDGTVWYGSGKNTLDYCAKYANKEHPFEADEDLMDEIKTWFNE